MSMLYFKDGCYSRIWHTTTSEMAWHPAATTGNAYY